MKNNYRIVVLIGSSVPNLNTLATLLDANLNIVGAVVAQQKKMGINTKFLKGAIKKQGLIAVVLQAIERIVYKILNSKKDKMIFENLFDENEIKNKIESFSENILHSYAYDSPESISFIKEKKADLIVIHTPYWVSKKVRDIVNGNVIGGHPGITQFYRGVHSPFWAIYKNDLENIGYSVFWVDAGVDSGDIISQGKIKPDTNDSYITLSWKGMKAIAYCISEILSNSQTLSEIPRVKNDNLTDNTIFYHPTIFNYMKYKLNNKFQGFKIR